MMKKRFLPMITALFLAFVMMFSVTDILPGGTVEVEASAPKGQVNYTVSVASGYLALRTAMAFDSRNEIGQLYSGDIVCFQSVGDSTYWYVYAPKLGKYGYVNKNYLIGSGAPTGGTTNPGGTAYTVSVAKGYLALRTAMAYDSRNEIGQLYSGDVVYYQSTGNDTYWYVYSPKYGKYGYVNRNYLLGAGSSSSGGGSYSNPGGACYTVSVASGYLALRTAMAFDSRNEIGQLYSGDVVYYQSTGNDTYWYVYSPKYGKYGYVNRNYLLGAGSSSSGGGSYSNPGGTCYTVKVAQGYLALRTAMAYDSRNEIGQLYTGDVVYYQSTGDSTYWYVYSPKYGKYGYVNKNYLY